MANWNGHLEMMTDDYSKILLGSNLEMTKYFVNPLILQIQIDEVQMPKVWLARCLERKFNLSLQSECINSRNHIFLATLAYALTIKQYFHIWQSLNIVNHTVILICEVIITVLPLYEKSYRHEKEFEYWCNDVCSIWCSDRLECQDGFLKDKLKKNLNCTVFSRSMNF